MTVGRVVEVQQDGRHLALHRGFLVVKDGGTELGRIALDQIAAVVGNAHGLTWSSNLALALAERGIPLVLCGTNHTPAAVVWPLDSHHAQAGRVRAQVEAGKPLVKRLWRDIVRLKLRGQADALELAGAGGGPALRSLAGRVRSGDPDNLEAQAARRYWPALFGPAFRRDRAAGGVNGMLNYGYAILRSGVARAVMAAGLHPSIGLHHSNRYNPMCLVDDLLEPFRPLADLAVHGLAARGVQEVDGEVKRTLAALMVADVRTEAGVSPLMTVQQRFGQSLAACLEGDARGLTLPGLIDPGQPLFAAARRAQCGDADDPEPETRTPPC